MEVWLEEQLRIVYPDLDIHCNRMDAINAELDFYFPALRLAFELNGILHYEPIYGRGQLARTQTNDTRKWAACLERGIELCVIDSSQFTYFKARGAEKYLDMFRVVVDRVFASRTAEGEDVGSQDPTRGKVRILNSPRPSRALKALQKAMRWQEELTRSTQTDIAKKEGILQNGMHLTLSLLYLPESMRDGILRGDAEFDNTKLHTLYAIARSHKRAGSLGAYPRSNRS